MKINVHAGHNPDGRIGHGAVGIIKESTENRAVTQEIIQQLKGLGHEVYDCTVDNGTSQSDVLVKIVKKCNTNPVDLDVSIHFNAFNGKAKGTEVLLYNMNSKGKIYAQRVVDEIAALGYVNRGLKANSSLYVLRKTKAPAILVECCFVDNAEDVARYDYKSMATAIVKGIVGDN